VLRRPRTKISFSRAHRGRFDQRFSGNSEKYFDLIVERFEARIGQSVRDAVIFWKSFAQSDFVQQYNSFKGNAYGLANTLNQTAILKPSCRSRKLKNLFFTGQLTVPGPGVPPSLISGEVVAKQVVKHFG
jgi:phytoene desaturase